MNGRPRFDVLHACDAVQTYLGGFFCQGMTRPEGGLDVEGITHVIHYTLPVEAQIYIHRSGRTARAGTPGIPSITRPSAAEPSRFVR